MVCRSHKVSTMSSVFMSSFLVGVILCSTFLAGCGANHIIPLPRINLAYRSLVTVQVCIQATRNYPQEFISQALNAITDATNKLATSNQGGATIYVTWLSHDTWNAQTTVITVPSYGPDPYLQLIPTPNPTSGPYSGAESSAEIDQANAQATSVYNQQITDVHRELQKMQDSVRSQTNQLRRLTPPRRDPGNPDVFGCLERADQRLRHVGGEKFLLLVGNLEGMTANLDTGDLVLSGTKVRAMWHSCLTSDICETVDDGLKQALIRSGVHESNIHYYDPAQSLNVSTVSVVFPW